MNILKNLSTNSGRIENWLGSDIVEKMSKDMKNWYGPKISVAGVPGNVYIGKDGDFVGRILTGYEATGYDLASKLVRRIKRGWKWYEHNLTAHPQFNTGFASLSDLISEATAGKLRKFYYNKTGATGVVGVTSSLWGLGSMPVAGSNASAAPGGDNPDDSSTGSYNFSNPTNPDTQHLVQAMATASVAGQSLLCYDRLFEVDKTVNSSATQSVSGVLTRYTNTTGGTVDSAEGNFLFVEVGGTALAATAHNWAECIYTDQSGNAVVTLPSLTGNSGAIVRRLDHPTYQWFAPLATNDTGITALTTMKSSVAIATGVANFVIGHPIAWIPVPIINLACISDYINTSFNLVRIFDNAALTFLEVNKPATTATTYNIELTTVLG